MKNQLEQLSSNPWVTLISVIFGILGVICSIYFGVKSIQKKKIKVFLENNELITNKSTNISKLRVLYDDENIDLLSVTKVTFWNSSLPTINSSDIISLAPFSVSLRNGLILDVSVLKGNNTSNQIDVKLVNNTAQISFDYLDRKEGGIIQIIHTGKEDSASISKKLKGGRIITVNYGRKYMFIPGLLAIFPLIVTFSSILNFFFSISKVYMCIFSILYSVIIIIYILLSRKPFIPKNCKTYRGDD